MRVGEIFDPVERAREKSYNDGYKEGFVDGYKAKCNELKRYEWHDLRRNPDDLPPNEHEVDIAYERYESMYTARAIYEDGTVHSEDSRYVYDELNEWCEYCEDTDDYIIPRGWIEVTAFAENMGLVDIPVIAWRELAPFEEEE
ncbi:MAG: hypothetical protein KBS66_07520 [Eubacterium sp.]|nr:hypothetical protein [Candidatus Colimonas fimequi]